MRNILRLTACAVILCFLTVSEASASISSNAQIAFLDSNSDSIDEAWGVAWISPDYGDQVYYRFYVEVSIIQDENIGAYASDACPSEYNCGGAWASAGPLPYDPNVVYDLWSSHSVETVPYDGSGYIDYYGYATSYPYGDPLYYPWAYNFTGSGSSQSNVYGALLGYLVAAASGGETHGPPHHVKVIDDDYPQTNCGSKRRLLKLRPVDSNGRYAGQIRVRETLETTDGVGLQSIYNSCQDDNFTPIGCDPINSISRSFTDQLWVGCPSAGGECGFQPPNGPLFVSRWWWCPRTTSTGSVLLTSNVYYLTHNHVAINGNESKYPSGTQLY